MTDTKTQRLQQSGTLNPSPKKVADPLFADSEFFDPRDLLQVRYEMVRRSEEASLRETAECFGASVPTCVRANRAFREGGLQALIPQRRGPRGAHKITPRDPRLRRALQDPARACRQPQADSSHRRALRRHRASARAGEGARAGQKKLGPPVMTPWLDAQGLERYCCWRRQWRANVETQAIAILRHHGMARALELTASVPSPPAPSSGAPPALDLIPVMHEAAAMVRDLLAHECNVEASCHV